MSCDDPIQIEALKKLLEDALKAYHNLLTGKMARVFVDQNGERVEFTAAKKTDLYNYIQQLKAELGYPGCGSAANSAPPLRFLF